MLMLWACHLQACVSRLLLLLRELAAVSPSEQLIESVYVSQAEAILRTQQQCQAAVSSVCETYGVTDRAHSLTSSTGIDVAPDVIRALLRVNFQML